jgi:hypothetical protein
MLRKDDDRGDNNNPSDSPHAHPLSLIKTIGDVQLTTDNG